MTKVKLEETTSYCQYDGRQESLKWCFITRLLDELAWLYVDVCQDCPLLANNQMAI